MPYVKNTGRRCSMTVLKILFVGLLKKENYEEIEKST